MRFLLISLGTLVVFCSTTSFPITTEEKSHRQVYDVVIVGAGLTGLAAARKIQQQRPNASVVLLEARGQVGGRVRADSMATAVGDDFVDIGAQFVSRDHRALQRVASELGVRLVPQSNCGERSLLLEGVRKRREVSFSPELSVRPTFRELIESPDAASLARQSVADFSSSQRLSVSDAAATNRLLQTLYDAPEQKVSALQLALTAASDNATVSELLLNTGHGQALLIEGGAYQLTRTMADGLHVEYNQKVVGINRQSSPAVIMTSSSSFLGRQVIVALPPAVAATVVYSPALEESFHSFLQQYRPAGNAFYFTLTFPTAFWRGNKSNGQLIHTSASGDLAWMTTFDTTTDTHCVSSTGTTGILWGIAHFVRDLPPADRHTHYVRVVKRALKTQGEPLDVKDTRFSTDPLAMGSIGVFPPGVSLDSLNYLTGAVSDAKATVFAASEFSNVSTGLMNGAIVAGETAADVVLQKIPSSMSTPLRDAPKPVANFVYSTSTHYPPLETKEATPLNGLARDAPLPVQNFVYSTSTHYPPMETKETSSSPNALARDAPLPVQNFAYSTSTHYPPLEPKEEAHIVLAPALLQDGAFQYSTSTHYPPSMYESNSIKEDAAVQQDTPSSQFVYKTSTHYPPTERPQETTTYRHFSFGNLGESATEDDAPANLLAPAVTEKAREGQGFVYRTSTMYPPTERPPEATTFVHFSFGNVGEADKKQKETALGRQEQATADSALVLRTPLMEVKPEIVEQLQQVAQQAPSSDTLSVARTLNGLVQQLLQSLQR